MNKMFPMVSYRGVPLYIGRNYLKVLLFSISGRLLALALPHTPDHTGGGTTIGLTPGPGAAHDQDLVLTTVEEEGEYEYRRQVCSY